MPLQLITMLYLKYNEPELPETLSVLISLLLVLQFPVTDTPFFLAH